MRGSWLFVLESVAIGETHARRTRPLDSRCPRTDTAVDGPGDRRRARETPTAGSAPLSAPPAIRAYQTDHRRRLRRYRGRSGRLHRVGLKNTDGQGERLGGPRNPPSRDPSRSAETRRQRDTTDSDCPVGASRNTKCALVVSDNTIEWNCRKYTRTRVVRCRSREPRIGPISRSTPWALRRDLVHGGAYVPGNRRDRL